MDDLGKKTASGLVYKFAERTSVQLASFLVSVVLARLLLPEQFGTITLVAVVISILDVFVQFGFGNSLVVNKNSDDLDFSTCFHFGLVFAMALYVAVYFTAPLIASFLGDRTLVSILRVMAIRIPIGAINSVQHAYVSKHMIFRKFFVSTSIGTVISGIVAIVMAFSGFGVWALVAQYIGNVLIDTVCLSFIVDWRPKLIFSFQRLKVIYDYGWKILVAGLIDTVYGQLRSFIIARRFSTADLAYYGKGIAFPNMGMSAVEPAIDGVIFPALSNCNDDPSKMKAIARRMIKSSSFIIFPLMVGLFVVAEPLIVEILTDKWIESVDYLRIGCLAYIFRPIQVINNCVIRASGNSALLLKLDVLKKTIGVVLLIASIPYGVKAVAFSFVIVNIISTFINIWPNRNILKYGFREQFIDILYIFLLAIAMGVIVWLITLIGLEPIWTLILQVVIGASIYLLLASLFNIESYFYLKKKFIQLITL